MTLKTFDIMEQFNLEKYLENPSRKVVTRDERQVCILKCCAINNRYPIIGTIITDGCEEPYSWTENGNAVFYQNGISDLFFADEEEELTEFEKALDVFAYNSKLEASNPNYYDWLLKSTALNLLDLARKEIRKEQQEKLGTLEMPIDATEPYYIKGREDALKSLPKWKKGTPPSATTLYIIRKGYYMPIKEVDELFEALPKEE